MAKSGLNVYKQPIDQPMPLRIPQWLIDDACRLAEQLGSSQAYYDWSSKLPRDVIMNHERYHAAILARLVEVEAAQLGHQA